jgi:hypothetical protein
LAGSVVTAGQQQATQRKPPETRSASCIVRIAVDPVIMPLDPATVQGLLYSSGVAGAAVRETLQRDSMDYPSEKLIEMEWLNESSPRSSQSSAWNEQEGYDADMMRQLQEIYGGEYARQLFGQDSTTREEQNRPAGRTSPSAVRSGPASGHGQSATIRLSVHLPDGVPPVADEFLRATISNLRSSLSHAYDVYIGNLDDQLSQARHQYNSYADFEAREGGTNEAARIREQLERVVDLSALTPEMPIAEAVSILRKSVDPPLNIVVLWNDLMDNLQVEPSTPINIDGMASVKLGTALDLLVKGLPSVNAKAMWRIKGDAIVIATAAAIGQSAERTGQANVETDVRTLVAQKNDLTNKLRDIELSWVGQEARRKAIADQIARTEADANARLSHDEVTKELETLVELSMQNLGNIRKLADSGRASTAELGQATESLTRARIELARRREELSKQVGGGQLEQLSSELSRIAIDGAEKQAQRTALREQLDQVKQQLAQASTFDPEAARMRMAREALDILARRVADLQTRIANLAPPMVTVIGAN